MTKQSEKTTAWTVSQKHVLIGGFVLVLTGLVLCVLFAIAGTEHTAIIGDSMGSWNAVVTGASLAFAAGALLIQSKELAENTESQRELAKGAVIDRRAAQLSAIKQLRASTPDKHKLVKLMRKYNPKLSDAQHTETLQELVEEAESLQDMLFSVEEECLIHIAFPGDTAAALDYLDRSQALAEKMDKHFVTDP